MKRKDIRFKKGDKIYFKHKHSGDDDYFYCDLYAGHTIEEIEKMNDIKITKIERIVKYKTIYEAPKSILDKEEKEYLEAVLRPFKNKMEFIEKRNTFDKLSQYIVMGLPYDEAYLPNFDKDTMYKGMELGKRYTLEELGLFEGE